MRMRINKRGVMQALTDVAVALIVLLIAIIFVTIFTKLKENKTFETTQIMLYETRIENALSLYLKQPVIVDGQEMTLADLLILAYLNQDNTPEKYVTKFRQESESFFATGIYSSLIDSMRITIGGSDFVYHYKTLTPPPAVRALPRRTTAIEFYLPTPSSDLKALKVKAVITYNFKQ